ncbi:MAG: IF-2-associated domain-containing protein, partial [Magnetococcus sp. DMHC-8]
MSDIKKDEGEGDDEGKLRLSAPRRIVLKKTVEGGSIRQNFSHGRSKSVVVEVRKKRTFVKAGDDAVPDATGKMDGGIAASAGVGDRPPADDRPAGMRVGGHPKQILE